MTTIEQPDAYEFDLNGQTEFRGTMSFNPEEQALITGVHTSLEQPLYRCNFAHEVEIAKNYTQEEFRGIALARRNRVREGEEEYRRIIHRCLCPKELREARPLCAHASQHYEPAPYAKELEALMNLRIIHRAKWTHLFQTFLIPMIRHSDQAVASSRYDEETNTIEWRTHLQDRDAKVLNEKRVVLLHCTSVALGQETVDSQAHSE